MSTYKHLDQKTFEVYLAKVCERLTIESQTARTFNTSKELEDRARSVFQELLNRHNIEIEISPPAQDFPDIIIGPFGVEVKFTEKNTWRSVANSISEGSRDESVNQIYILFGKMGGTPEVRWAKYDDCVIHVRTSHVPRFEVEMTGRESLFNKIGISYLEFSKLPIQEKMKYVRTYVRGRIRPGEYYWWVEQESTQAVRENVSVFSDLPKPMRRQLLAEAVLLFPQIINPHKMSSREFRFALHILNTYHVFCPSVGMLFDADFSPTSHETIPQNEIILQRISEIEEILVSISHKIPNQLFVEYWGESVMPDDRIRAWIQKMDKIAPMIVNSDCLKKLKKVA